MLGDEFDLSLVDFVALIEAHVGQVETAGPFGVGESEVVLLGVQDAADGRLVEDDDLADVAGWEEAYLLRERLKESW
jgi:hypothetical protein